MRYIIVSRKKRLREMPDTSHRTKAMGLTCLVYLCLVLLIMGVSLCVDKDHDLNRDIASWSRLKRDAGYFTESGVWRGGFWVAARHIETKSYHCQRHTDTHCMEWTLDEISSEKHEFGNCRCMVSGSDFCLDWRCEAQHMGLSERGNRMNGFHTSLQRAQDCQCQTLADHGMYCSQWNCTETSSDGYVELEDYVCLAGDVGEQYCFRWKGNVTSDIEIESSVCECFQRGERYCEFWQCTERGILRCASYGFGLCRLQIAIAVGGGGGSLFLTIGVTGIVRGRKNKCETILSFVALFASLALFSCAVLMGGVPGLLWTLLIWFFLLGFFICVVRLRKKPKLTSRVSPQA